MTPDEFAAVRGNDKLVVALTSIATVVLAGLTGAAIKWGPDGIGEMGIFMGIPLTIFSGVAERHRGLKR